MYKEINDCDRLIIGVREWAVVTVFEKGLGTDRWLKKTGQDIDTKPVIQMATELEQYVVKGIFNKENKD